jgi:DNA-binding beta-propeller fold protein YncE
VYAVDTFNHRVQRFRPTGEFAGLWGEPGTGEGQFQAPSGIALAGDGTVYVIDTANNRVQRFDGDGEFLTSWGTPDSEKGQFADPAAVAIAPDGSVLVADRVRDAIQRFSPDGEFLDRWGMSGSAFGQILAPQGLAVASDGTVFVADSGNHRVQVFRPDGTPLRVWGGSGSGEGRFAFPAGIALGPDDEVYVVDRGNSRVQVFGPDGVFLRAFGEAGSGPGQLRQPQGIAVGDDGTVFVSDLRNSRVQLFSADGRYLDSIGSLGAGDGQFAWPTDVDVASDGTLLVTDSGVAGGGNNRVQQFLTDGTYVGQWGGSGGLQGQMRDPYAVARSRDGTVYVADLGNHRLQAFAVRAPDWWRAQYYGNRYLASRELLVTRHQDIAFDWGNGSPRAEVPADGFSARFERGLELAPGLYSFTVRAQGGVRLWVDDELLMDHWLGLAGEQTAVVEVRGDQAWVRLEFADVDGPASLFLEWAPAGDEPFELYVPLAER